MNCSPIFSAKGWISNETKLYIVYIKLNCEINAMIGNYLSK